MSVQPCMNMPRTQIWTMTSAFGKCIYLRFHNIHSTDTTQMMQFQITAVFIKKEIKTRTAFLNCMPNSPLQEWKRNDMNVAADIAKWQHRWWGLSCGWLDSSVLEFGFYMDSLIYITCIIAHMNIQLTCAKNSLCWTIQNITFMWVRECL
jgi:hypothetical protein